MNYLFPDRAPFDPHSVTGRICTDKTFVLVKSGTWGLANWGLQRAPFIKDFLASMVRDKGGFADKEELVSAGIVRYGFKESSLRMTLSINKHVFKMLPDGTVKLL
jgi:hypothetical protein